jgi:3-polyprenyl-4-hydroxybenzoate decarboxylase
MRAYRDLREFLSLLEREQQLLRVTEQVNSSRTSRRPAARWRG